MVMTACSTSKLGLLFIESAQLLNKNPISPILQNFSSGIFHKFLIIR